MRRKGRNAWKKKQTETVEYNTPVNTHGHNEVNTGNEPVVEQQNDSDDKVAGNVENSNLNDTGMHGEVTEDKNEMEGMDDQDLQGKSTGLNPDQSSNTVDNQPEIENDNVQGSAPSPNANDENVQNINDNTQTNNEDNQEVTSEPVPASESEPIEENVQSESNQNDNQESNENDNQESNENDNQQKIENDSQQNVQNSNKEEVFQSEYVNEQEKSHVGNNGDVNNEEERSHTPELKPQMQEQKKRITLKRSPPVQRPRRPSSPLEDGEIKEPQEKSKKIMLKRRTNDDAKSDFIDKIIIKRRTSAEDKSEKRRLSAEEKTHIVIARPMKPGKPVKLRRPVSCPEGDRENLPRGHRLPWGKSDWLDNISATMYKIDVDTIKVVCPTVEFLKESDVKLEDIPKEHILKSESEVTKNEEKEEEKTEDESDREQSEEEDSAEEQKIEANPNIIALNRKISIVDDTASKLRPPPSPAKNPPSTVLYITNLVRPFTLKQLKELLERTGKIKEDGFWTDRIKSKCYVQYNTIEEAEITRNALHGVYWPIGNGKQLMIEYATEEDMDKAKNPVPLPIAIIDKPEKENREPEVIEAKRRDRQKERDKVREKEREEKRREPSDREKNKTREEHRRRHSRSRSRSRERVRKHSRRSYTPEDLHRKKHKKADDVVPQKLMDDLFLKTKTTPSIYWQPLSPQEIETKQQQRLVRMEEHKRRIEENRGRFNRDRDRRGTFRRR